MSFIKRILNSAAVSKTPQDTAAPQTSPVQKAPAQPAMAAQIHVTHYLGKFQGMVLELDQHVLLLSPDSLTPPEQADALRQQGKPVLSYNDPGQMTCGHYKVEYGTTPYIFWDNPTDAQRQMIDRLSQKESTADSKQIHSYIDLSLAPGGDDFSAHGPRPEDRRTLTIMSLDHRHIPYDPQADLPRKTNTDARNNNGKRSPWSSFPRW